MCVCVHESEIMTRLIHHGQSPFDYKRRGLVINCWIQLPGQSFDTRSQSICTATPPYPQGFAPVYPYKSHTLIHPPTHAPNALSCTLTSCPAPISHLSLCSSFTSTALHPLYSSDFCFILTPAHLILPSPAAWPYILFLHLCTPLCPASSCSHNLSFSSLSVQPGASESPKHYCFDLIAFKLCHLPHSCKLQCLICLLYL